MGKRGFSLPLVLIIMAIIGILSAVIMDLATSYFHSSQAGVEQQKLYNAAQSGVEAARAWLYDNRSRLEMFSSNETPTCSSDLLVKVSGSAFSYTVPHSHVDSIDVYVLTCDYQVPANDHIEGLPPAYRHYSRWSAMGDALWAGQSCNIDMSRIPPSISGAYKVFLIRSFAVWGNRKAGIETMVALRIE